MRLKPWWRSPSEEEERERIEIATRTATLAAQAEALVAEILERIRSGEWEGESNHTGETDDDE